MIVINIYVIKKKIFNKWPTADNWPTIDLAACYRSDWFSSLEMFRELYDTRCEFCE